MTSRDARAGDACGNHLQLRAEPYASLEGVVARITYVSMVSPEFE